MADGTGVRAESEPSTQTVAALFVAYVAVWSLYFAIAESQASIHNDMTEAYAWGRQFQLGYNQHPPFWAWLCGAWFTIFPRAGWAFAILSSLNAAIGLLGSWKLIGRFARGDKRIAATALLLLAPFYTFWFYKYNANSIFLSIWPWTMYFFVRAIDEGGIADAILFGVGMGLALLCKYYALILGATCFLAALQHPGRAGYFRSPSPYVSIAVAAALCTPHIAWLLSSGAPPVRYLSRISGRGYGAVTHYAAIAFFGAIAQHAVVFAVIAFAAFFAPTTGVPTRSRFRLLATLAGAAVADGARRPRPAHESPGSHADGHVQPLAAAGDRDRGISRRRAAALALLPSRGHRERGGAGRLARNHAAQGLVLEGSPRHGAAEGDRGSRHAAVVGRNRQPARLCRRPLLRRRRRLLQYGAPARLRQLRLFRQPMGDAASAGGKRPVVGLREDRRRVPRRDGRSRDADRETNGDDAFAQILGA